MRRIWRSLYQLMKAMITLGIDILGTPITRLGKSNRQYEPITLQEKEDSVSIKIIALEVNEEEINHHKKSILDLLLKKRNHFQLEEIEALDHVLFLYGKIQKAKNAKL